jgi:hypothetical protein
MNAKPKIAEKSHRPGNKLPVYFQRYEYRLPPCGGGRLINYISTINT